MEIKTWDQVGIWLAVQFPVVAVCAFSVWYALRWTDKKHAEELQRNDAKHAAILGERDQRIAERDARIRELQAERERLMVLKFPSWGRGSEAGGGQQP